MDAVFNKLSTHLSAVESITENEIFAILYS